VSPFAKGGFEDSSPLRERLGEGEMKIKEDYSK